MPTAASVSQIRDLKLAEQGSSKLDWSASHMPLLRIIRDQFTKAKPFAGKRIALCLHLDAKTACLAKVVQAGGAEVAVVAANPLLTQDDAAAALVESGIYCYGWHGASIYEYQQHINQALDFRPDAIIDDGGDLVSALHSERIEQAKQIIGGCVQTDDGINHLRDMERDGKLLFPIVAVNDAPSKHLFDNRYGTGQSVWDAIMRTTNLLVAGKTAVVVGYGWCGKGVAMRAKGLGAKVIVTEVDPVKALEALMDGFAVMPLIDAARVGDFFITVTGTNDVITAEHFYVMKGGAVLCNAGHSDEEISKTELEMLSTDVCSVHHNTQEYQLADGRKLYLLAEGRLVNLAAGDGQPIEVMDMNFALYALALRYVVENRHELHPKVYSVPGTLDQHVAELRLKTWGIEID